MDTQQHMEERLWPYIDGTASAEEKTLVEKLVATDTAWKAKYYELLQVHQWLQSSELEQPSMRFSKNVMEEIARLHIAPAAKSYINQNIIRGLGLFFILTIIGFMVYGFGQVQWNTGTDGTISKNLDKVDFSKFFDNTWMNALMMVNVVLGLLLLDNYLSNKRKKYQQQT